MCGAHSNVEWNISNFTLAIMMMMMVAVAVNNIQGQFFLKDVL
jgi:hypothetical protein